LKRVSLISLNPAWINDFFRASISAKAKGPGVAGLISAKFYKFIADFLRPALDGLPPSKPTCCSIIPHLALLSLKYIRVKGWSNVAHINTYPWVLVAVPSSLIFLKY
jgi:hypothetical protein